MTPDVALDPKKAKLLHTIATPGTLYSLLLHGERMFGAGSDGFLHAVDLKAEKPAAEKKWKLHDNYVSGMVLRKDQIISCSYDRKVVWSELATGKVLREVEAHEGWVRKLALTPDGSRLLTIGDDMRLKVWNASSGEFVGSVIGHEAKTPEGYLSALYALAVSPDGKHAATGDRAGFVCLWEIESRKLLTKLHIDQMYTFDAVKRARAIGGVRGLAFSPDGTNLAISGIGPVTNVDGFVGPCRIELWNWSTGKRVAFAQDKHQAILNHVSFTADGKWIVAAGGGDGGGVIVFWPGTEVAPTLAKPKGHLQDFQLRDGKLYAAGHAGFQVWQVG